MAMWRALWLLLAGAAFRSLLASAVSVDAQTETEGNHSVEQSAETQGRPLHRHGVAELCEQARRKETSQDPLDGTIHLPDDGDVPEGPGKEAVGLQCGPQRRNQSGADVWSPADRKRSSESSSQGLRDVPGRARRIDDSQAHTDYMLRQNAALHNNTRCGKDWGGPSCPLQHSHSSEGEAHRSMQRPPRQQRVGPAASGDGCGPEQQGQVRRREGPEGAHAVHDRARQTDDPRARTNYTTRRKIAPMRPADRRDSRGSSTCPAQQSLETEDHSLVLLGWKVMAVAAQRAWSFEEPFPDGVEPQWWQRVLRDSLETQRGGCDMWDLADRIEARVKARRDPRYEAVACPWVDGLRRAWHEREDVPSGEPVADDEIDFLEEDIELTLRTHWLHEIRPLEPHNLKDESEPASSHPRRGADCLQHSDRVEVTRSRSPPRCSTQMPAHRPRGEPRGLLQRRDAMEGEEASFVVKKFLLKKKDSRTLRRLVDNPHAWRSGPGVTVTTSTRVLAPRGTSRGRGARTSVAGRSSQCEAAPRATSGASGSAGPSREAEDEGESGELDELLFLVAHVAGAGHGLGL